MSVNSSEEEGGHPAVWLRVRILNSLVFSLRTTVRAVRDSLREADQSFAARLRIIVSVSEQHVTLERILDGDFCRPVGYNRAIVDTEGKLVQALSIAAEVIFEYRQGESSQIPHRLCSKVR